MSSKLSYIVIVLICVQACSVVSRPLEDSNEGISLQKALENINSRRDLKDEDINQMKLEMSNELTPSQMEKFVEIMQKFKEGTPTKDKIEGMIQLIVFSMSVKSNKTITTLDTITENTI